MNYCLLTNKLIQTTITESERVELNSMFKVKPANSSAGTTSIDTSSMITFTSMSDLTDDLEIIYNQY